MGVFDRYKFRDWAFLKDFLSAVMHLFTQYLVLMRAYSSLPTVCVVFFVLEALRFQNISCLVKFIVFGAWLLHYAIRDRCFWKRREFGLLLANFFIWISLVHVNIYFNVVIVLCERVAHVPFELGNCEVQFKLTVLSAYKSLEDGIGETANEATLVVLYDLVVVVLQEFQFEIGQVETTIVISGELISNIQDDLVWVSFGHKRVCHRSPNLEHLIVRRD